MYTLATRNGVMMILEIKHRLVLFCGSLSILLGKAVKIYTET